MAELRPYEPTWRDRLANVLMGDGRSSARQQFVEGLLGSRGLGQTGMGLVDLTPAGIPLAVQESRQAFEQGSPVAGLLGAMAVLPAARPAALAAKTAVGEAAQGIRAYHSSPHDFNRFDLSKIGTGEGNQAYGHGLYVAESPKVSGQGGDYWRQFWNKMPSGPERSAATALFANKFDRDKAIDHLLRDVEWNFARGIPGRYGDGPDVEKGHRLLAQEAQQALDILRSGQIAGPRTYEVNINARPEQFLDYDKPLSQQSDSVQKALRSIDIADESVWPRLTARDAYEMLRVDSMGDDAFLRDQAYRLARRAEAGAGASAMLREAGIPGIKYLDAGSRDAGEGTRNYVVFDDSLIDIMRKYGLVGLLGGGAAGALSQQEDVAQ